MKEILIRKALNGFIVEDARVNNHGFMPQDPHVFETFGNLVAWLDQNLDKPKLDDK